MTKLMGRIGLASALFAALAIGPGAAEMRGVGAVPQEEKPGYHPKLIKVFDLYLGGIKGGEMVIALWQDDGRYHAEAVMRTAGIVGAVYEASFTAESEGSVAGAVYDWRYSSERFAAQSAMYEKGQFVEMTYANDAPSEIFAEPAFIPKPWQIDPSAQTGTLDPIAAALFALSPMPPDQICNRVVDIFDGRRRYEIELGAPEAHQGRLRCPAVYRRVAGFKPKLINRQAEFPFHIWFDVRDDGLAHIKRAAGDSMFGLAVILARD